MGTPLRPLSGAERQLWLLSRTRPFQVVLSLVLPTDRPVPAVDALRDALQVVAAGHPLLRVRVKVCGGVPIFEESEVPVPVRVVGHAPDLDAIIEDELNHAIPTDTGPLLRATLVTSESGPATMLLTFDHVAADGLSMASVLRDVLAALAPPDGAAGEPALHKAAADIVPSIQTIPKSTRRPMFWLRFLGRRLRELWWRLRSGAVRGLPHRAAPATEQRTRVTRRHLSADDVASLHERTTEAGVSVHAALCAAQILAIRGVLEGSGALPLAVYSPTNLRNRLVWRGAIGVPDGHLGQFVGYLRSLHRVAPTADLWGVAREVRHQIRDRLAASDDLGYHVLNHVLMWLLKPWFRPDETGAARLARAAAGSLSHTTIVTNLGAVDIGVPLDGDLYVASATLPGEVFVSGVARVGGRLGWNFSWTEPCLDAETAEALADATLEALRAALR